MAARVRCLARVLTSGLALGLGGLAVATGLLTAGAAPAAAQSVQGQLVDGEIGAPVEGALAMLLDPAGRRVAGALTNSYGRFVLRVGRVGVYTVRVERLGYETRTSDPIHLHAGQTFRIRMLTFQIPIEVDELRVEGEQQCVVRPEEGMALATVWEEARKALTIQEWTESEGF